LDFGAVKELTKIRIRFERAFAQEYRIDIADDVADFEGNWTLLQDRKDGKQVSYLLEIVLDIPLHL
jgi:hypothetical protein